MSAGEELSELKERAEKGKEEKSLAPVSLTMAVVAVLVATISLLGHRAHTEEILLQNKSTDEWAYYQAKNLRRNNLEALNDVLAALEGKNEKAEQVSKRFEADIEKYREEQKDIQGEARKLEDELRHESRRADRFDLAEVFLEISLVVTSITLLTGRRQFWILGIVLATTGLVVAFTVLLLR
jgi:chromosome segregation ATPase